MKKTITDNQLGTIILTKSDRAKRLTIRLKSDHIAVTLPSFSVYEDALEFVYSKREWILTHRQKLNVRKKAINNENPFRTLTFEVKLQPAVRKDFFICLKNNTLTIEYPETTKPESENSQKVFCKAIENGLRHEAKRVLPNMLKNLAQQHQFSYTEVKINSSKSRWGSCSSRGNINLSFYTMLLPEHLVKYILLHELCHTKEMNHGPKFWYLLEKVSGNNAKVWSKELKNHNMNII